MLAPLILLTTSQRDILAWRALHPVIPTHQRSLRYQYPQLPHIATLRAGRQVQGWVCPCVCRHPLWAFLFTPSLSSFFLNALTLVVMTPYYMPQHGWPPLWTPTGLASHCLRLRCVFLVCINHHIVIQHLHGFTLWWSSPGELSKSHTGQSPLLQGIERGICSLSGLLWG